jgi:hypothetical protein
MLSINASFKSGTALTYFSWRKIVSNFSAKSNYFLMSPIRQIKTLTLRRCLISLQLPDKLGYHRGHGTPKTISD